MAENLEYKGCPQKDSAEHESYAVMWYKNSWHLIRKENKI